MLGSAPSEPKPHASLLPCVYLPGALAPGWPCWVSESWMRASRSYSSGSAPSLCSRRQDPPSSQFQDGQADGTQVSSRSVLSDKESLPLVALQWAGMGRCSHRVPGVQRCVASGPSTPFLHPWSVSVPTFSRRWGQGDWDTFILSLLRSVSGAEVVWKKAVINDLATLQIGFWPFLTCSGEGRDGLSARDSALSEVAGPPSPPAASPDAGLYVSVCLCAHISLHMYSCLCICVHTCMCVCMW